MSEKLLIKEIEKLKNKLSKKLFDVERIIMVSQNDAYTKVIDLIQAKKPDMVENQKFAKT